MNKTSTALLSIGQVAAQAGIRTSAIRYYESVGVLSEPERIGGQRRYPPEIVTRLAFVGVAQQAGFSLEEIRELLDGAEQDRASERLQSLAKRKLPDVEGLISRAEAMKGWLEAAGNCECPTLDECALFGDAAQESLQGGAQVTARVISSR
jgi:MerR family redox-sensitive transcriptional activator SoxR